MATTYAWKIERLDCYPTFETFETVVCTVHWRLEASDGELQASVYGTQAIDVGAISATFTPYADLTEAQVAGWVQAAMGSERVASLQAVLAQQIQDQISPPVVSPPLPWLPEEEA